MNYSKKIKKQLCSVTCITFAGLAVFLWSAATVTANDSTSREYTAYESLDQSRHDDAKASAGLINRVYEQGTLPIIVRLSESDMPYGFAPDIVKTRSEMIGNVQSMILDDVSFQTAQEATGIKAKRFTTIPAMALQVDASELEALLAHPDVVEIIEDIPLEPNLDDSVELIGGDTDGAFETYTGQGQTIAIIDTGVDKNHPFLTGKVVSEACYSSNNVENGVTSLCPGGVESSTAVNSGLNCSSDISHCGHGTNVAGVAAGSSKKFSGVAKDASIIAIQVFSLFADCGSYSSPCLKTYSSDVISALERVYALRKTYSIASVNMSFGSGLYGGTCADSVYRPLIDTLRAAGIATVISSGNGSATASISSPACVASAISVGSTTKGDQVSDFSNSADFLSLLAPGSSITTSVPGTKYYAKSGTSIAAPHVAGAWAVLKQAKPDASVAEVLDALQSTGEPIVDKRSGAASRVKPRIDVQRALSALSACQDDADCNDGVFCNGAEVCASGTCIAGSVPCEDDEVCAEESNVCTPLELECVTDEDCAQGALCSSNICVEEEISELMIAYKNTFAAKLKKDKKLKLTITGGDGFDPYADVSVDGFSVLKTKPKVKVKNGIFVKSELQVTVLVPSGCPKGTFEVRVGSASGLIEIL